MHIDHPSTTFDHPRGPGCYALSPVGDIIALAVMAHIKRFSGPHRSANVARVLVVDNANGKLLRHLEVGEKHLNDAGFRLRFSPDGALLAIGGSRAVRVVSVGSSPAEWHFQGHTRVCKELEFSGDGKELVSHNEDGTALVWELAPSKRVR